MVSYFTWEHFPPKTKAHKISQRPWCPSIKDIKIWGIYVKLAYGVFNGNCVSSSNISSYLLSRKWTAFYKAYIFCTWEAQFGFEITHSIWNYHPILIRSKMFNSSLKVSQQIENRNRNRRIGCFSQLVSWEWLVHFHSVSRETSHLPSSQSLYNISLSYHCAGKIIFFKWHIVHVKIIRSLLYSSNFFFGSAACLEKDLE